MDETMIHVLTMPWVQAALPWLLVALLIAWVALRVINSGRLLAFNNPTGRVLVSRGAIKGLIARVCGTVEAVGQPQSRIFTRGGKLRVRLYIQLRGNARLNDVAGLLQEKLDMALRQNLGIEKIGKIDVIVTEIQPAARKNGGVTKAVAPWEEA